MDGTQQIMMNLQKTLEKMEITLNAIDEAIVYTDGAGHILWCNTPFDLLVCQSHTEVLGRSFVQLLKLQPHNREMERDEHPLTILKKSGTLDKTMYNSLRDGLEMALQISGTTLQFDNDPDIYLFFLEDVTPIQRAENILYSAHENLEARARERAVNLVEISKQFEAIHDNAVDAIITIDPSGTIETLNPAVERIFGYNAAELIGSNIKLLMPEPFRSQHDDYIQNYVRTGESKIIGVGREVTGRRKNGEPVPLYLAVSEVQLGEGQQRRLFTGILRDISEQKLIMKALEQAKFEAEEANRAKSDFLARISHEIRTPLNAILGMADLLSESELDEEQAKHVLVSKAAGQHLVNIIGDLLDVARIEAGKLELDRAPFHFQELVDEVISIIRHSAHKKELSVFSSLEENIPTYLEGDAKRLKLILVNLMGNSVKFTDRGSVSLHIGLDQELSNHRVMLHFHVRDTGIGISRELQQHIFESFSQADSLITRKYGGIGLGLTISRALVQLMGGKISVHSQLGKGSTFTFTAQLGKSNRAAFEAATSKVQFPQVSATANIQSAEEQPVRILLAEDSESIRLLFGTYLKDFACTIDFADNGQSAVEKFMATTYDIVLLDIQMPLMDGFTAARTIRQYEAEQDIPPTPLVALTGHSRESVSQACHEAGFTAHVMKPVSKQRFIETIRSLT